MKFFKDLLTEISYDDIYTYYIIQNHSVLESADHFKIVSSMFTRLTKYYDIKKPTTLHTANIKKTKKSKYGDENFNNQAQRAKTNLARYGVDNQFKRTDLMADVKQQIENKYGSKNNIAKNLLTRADNSGTLENSYRQQVQKTRQTVLEKYGVDWAAKAESVKDQIKESVKETFQERYGCDNYWLSDSCKRSNGSKNSKANLAFEQLLLKYKLPYEKEFLLENKYYDFRVNNFLIEINPTATHNSTWSPWNMDCGLDKTYHATKTDLAVKNGYRCVHIWDWDDSEKIIRTFLMPRQTIGARSCDIRLVPAADEIAFLNANHFQGCVKSSIALGLYYQNNLVMLMSFGKPRYSKKYQWELLRLCSSAKIIGGSEKLFAYFLKVYTPESIVSYCDLSKFDGVVYKKLGFKRVSRTIGKHWYNMKLHDHITDKLLYKRGFDALLGNIFGCYGVGSDNAQLMLAHGFVELYDSGQATYVFKCN